MRALVTGCAGFIGSHLTERLIAEGWQVTGVDAFTDYYDPDDKVANLAALTDEPAFDLVDGDLATIDLEGLLADRPAVFHLAAQAGVRSSFGEGFRRYLHDNVQATHRLFEAAAATGCRRVVYASSSSVYGDAQQYPCSEQAPTAPRSPYGITKRTCEDLGLVARSGGLDVVGLRYFTVYGPRQRPDMAIRRLCETAAGRGHFVLFGDGRQSRDFTFVDDAVDATVRAMTAPDPGPVLNVGGGHEATMNEVIDLIGELAGHPVPIERARSQRGDVRRTCADTTEARDRLGWSPRTTLRDGLAAQLDWVLDRPVDAGTGADADAEIVGAVA